MKIIKPPTQAIQLGFGYYQLTDLLLETGQPIARNLLNEARQLELLSQLKGNSDYVAKTVLLHTNFQVKKNIKKLKQLIVPEGERQVVEMKMRNRVNYAVVDLDEFGVELAASQQNPDEFICISLVNQDQQIVGHITFHNQQITLLSDCAINISGQVNDIQLLCVNTLADVLIEKPIRAIQVNLFCHTLEMDAELPGVLLQATGAHFLCFGLCYISATTQLRTGPCQIKAGLFLHYGHIESEFTEVTAELTEVHGLIAAKGKKGLTFATLGLQAHQTSHLHGSVVNLIIGAQVEGQTNLIYRTYLPHFIQVATPLYDCLASLITEYLMDDQEDLIGVANLAGLISARGLNISAAQANLSGKSYIQGDINIYTEGGNDKFILEKTAKIIFNGRFFRQQSQLGAWLDGAIQEKPQLEIYWLRIITPDLVLSEAELLRCKIAKKLVSASLQTVAKPGIIELPVLPELESYLYKPYDKTQFECLDVDDTPSEEKICKMFFSAENFDITGSFSLTSALVMFQGENIRYSAHLSNVSFFGCVDLLLKSVHLDLHSAVIDTDQQGSVLLTAEQDMQITNTQIAAEKIAIQADNLYFPSTSENLNQTLLSAASKIMIHSKHGSEISADSKLTLTSPEIVTWQCENFDHRGTLNFQQLSIKAENMIVMVFAKMQGKRLDLDASYLLAGLSSFKIETFSVQSWVSVIGLCHIASDYYCNTSIVNLSCALYTPSSLSLSLKSGLALSLAAANTVISILQLVLHEPAS